MTNRYTIESLFERLRQTDQVIERQRRYITTLADPSLKAIAANMLLEDTRLIMQRTHKILSETAAVGEGTHAARY